MELDFDGLQDYPRTVTHQTRQFMHSLLSVQFSKANEKLESLPWVRPGEADPNQRSKDYIREDMTKIVNAYVEIVTGPIDTAIMSFEEAKAYFDPIEEGGARLDEIERAWQDAIKYHGRPAIDHRTHTFNRTLVDSREMFVAFLDRIVNIRLEEERDR